MVRAGITGVTDAGAENGAGEAALLSSARLPQRLMLMGQEHLPAGNGYSVGPLKIAYDERDLPPVAHVADRIRTARKQQRTVAAHCVTLAELAVYLAALDLAGGAMPGDRIEHGGIIPGTLVPEIAERRLTIVTQPAFIHDRGDRYRDQIDPDEWPDLYRLCSLMVAGVAVAAGSDAPYGSLEPMVAVRAAMTRRTQAGAVIATAERLDWRRALGLYLGAPGDPGQPRWHLRPGDAADLCLVSPGEMAVTGTVIGGRLLYHRG
jgi:predicted amidohydrolase YtcJ